MHLSIRDKEINNYIDRRRLKYLINEPNSAKHSANRLDGAGLLLSRALQLLHVLHEGVRIGGDHVDEDIEHGRRRHRDGQTLAKLR